MRIHRTCVKISAALTLSLAAGAAQAQFTSTWTSPTTGNWSNAARWSTNPVFPNNGANTYSAVINATGSNYAVTLDLPVTINNFTLNSSNATFQFGGAFTLNVLQNASILGGSVINGQSLGGSIQVGGTLTISKSAIIGLGTIHALGPVIYTSVDPISIDDTDIDHGDGSALIEPGGDIILGEGARISNGATCLMTIQGDQQLRFSGSGAATSFTNLGTIVRDTGAATFDVQGVEFDNQGLLDVRTGTFRADTVLNISSGTLSGGSYKVTDGNIDFAGATITTNAAAVEIGTGVGTFAAFDTVATNDVAGQITIGDSRTYATVGALQNDGGMLLNTGSSLTIGGELTNTGAVTGADGVSLIVAGLSNDAAGEVTLGAAGAVASTGDVLNLGTLTTGAGTNVVLGVGANLLNVSGTTLDGGVFHLGGILQASNLAGLDTLNSRVTLDGAAASLSDGGGFDLTPGVRAVGAAGELGILNGRNLATTGNLTLATTGRLSVGAGSQLTVGGTITNFSSGTFSGGVLAIDGVLQFTGASVHTVDADISLDNVASDIIDENGATAFAGLNTVTASGSFAIRNGRDLTLAGGLTTAGALTVGNTSTLTSPGTITQTAGTTTLQNGTIAAAGGFDLQGGTLGGSGTIQGNLIGGGTIAPGQSPGLLLIDGDADLAVPSIFDVEIGGLARGTQHDGLDILGALRFDTGLAGLFRVTLIDGFVPQFGDRFYIASYDSRNGRFASTQGLGSLPGGLSFDLVYDVASPNSGETARYIVLDVVPAPAGTLALAMGLVSLGRRRRS